MDNIIQQLEEYISKYYPNVKGSDFTTLIDIIYMSALRNNITIPELLNDLYKGILDRDLFNKSNSGNIYNFIKNSIYKNFAERIKDINVDTNGGMVSVGKDELIISLGLGINPITNKPYVNIIKNLLGDF